MNRWQHKIFKLYWRCWTDPQASIMLGVSQGRIRWRRRKLGWLKRDPLKPEEFTAIALNASTLTDRDQAEDLRRSPYQIRAARRKINIKILRPHDKRVAA